MQNILSKLKQHPVLFVCSIFTIISAMFWMSSGIRVAWFMIWLLVPLILSTDKAFSCLIYMSLYMRVVINIKLFSIIICLSFLIVLIKEIKYLNKNKLLSKYLKILIIYAILLIIPLFYSVFMQKMPNIQFIYYLNMLNLLILIYLLKNKINFNLILIYSYGIIISSILAIVLYIGGLSWFPFDAGNRFCAFMQVCNTLGVACNICINVLYVMLVNNKISQRYGFGLMGILSVIGISTLSKNFLIIFTITLVVIFIDQFRKSKNKAKFIKYIIAVFVVLSPILLYYGVIMFDRFFGDKSYTNIIDTITTGRLDKWLIYLKPWYKKWYYIIFGLGLCHNYNTEYSSHSFYVGYISRLGIVGLLAIIGFVIFIVRQNSNKLKFKYLPLIIIAVICLAEDISYNTFNFIPMVIAFLPVMHEIKQ